MSRLKELRNLEYSNRLKFTLLDVLELREKGWVQKVMKSGAKTKDEIRQDAIREAQNTNAGIANAFVKTEVAGLRPQNSRNLTMGGGTRLRDRKQREAEERERERERASSDSGDIARARRSRGARGARARVAD